MYNYNETSIIYIIIIIIVIVIFHSITATFVIPYLLMLFVVGIPLFYLESLLGQALQKGPILAWYKLCPNLWGIGLSAIVVTVYISLYYNIIISWVILYFFNSFQDPLPWAKCNGQTINRSSDFYFNHINETDYASCVNDSTRYIYIHSLIYASILQSIIHLFTCIFVDLSSIHSIIHSFIIHKSMQFHLYIHPSFHSFSIYLCNSSSIHPTIHLSIHTSIFPFVIHTCTCISMQFFIYPSIHPPIHLSI